MVKAVLVDLRRCIGCRGDREATATEMNTDPTLEWTNPPSLSPQTYTYVRFVKTGSGESLKWNFAKIQCNHCIDPHCARACPTTALVKTESGPVVYRKELCIGCAYCVNACPFGIPKYDEENNIIEKCSFCSERLKEGMEPSCVQACPTDTLVLMDLNEAQNKATEAETNGLHTYGLHEVGGTSWVYISEETFEKLGFQKRSTATPSNQQLDIFSKFVGAGIFAGGAIYAAAKLYSQRREQVAQSERGS
jgi:formate dehydrogenase iron-sulfur subunit